VVFLHLFPWQGAAGGADLVAEAGEFLLAFEEFLAGGNPDVVRDDGVAGDGFIGAVEDLGSHKFAGLVVILLS